MPSPFFRVEPLADYPDNPTDGYTLHSPIHNLTDVNCTLGVQWVFKAMDDCVHTDMEYASVIIGLISVAIWMAVTFPQMYDNCRHSASIEGLSIVFLMGWLFGDSCNLVGCILTQQLAIQMYTAIWYVFADVLLLLQYSIYRFKIRRRKVTTLHVQEPTESTRLVLCLGAVLMVSSWLKVLGLPHWSNPSQYSSHVRHIPGGRNLLSLSYTPLFKGPIDESGYAIGIISDICYIGARCAQIYNNYKRQSTEGMSAFMFFMAIMGNVTYGLAVVLRKQDATFMIRHLPWLVGSLGVMSFDVFIFSQSFYYRHKQRVISELGNPTLTEQA